jgi:CHAD domain-containing protein
MDEGIEPDVDRRPVRTISYDADDLRLTRWGGSLQFRSPDRWTLTLPTPAERLVYETEHVLPAVPDVVLDPGEPPDVVAPAVNRSTRIDDVVRAALIASAHALINVDVALRIDGNATAVHRARVAVRRLRSDLRTFRPVLDPVWTATLRERVRWLGDALAAARDADVFLERLQRQAARLPDVDRDRKELVLNLVRGVRSAAYRQLGEVLRRPRYAFVLADLLEAARAPAFNERAAARARDAATDLLDEAWCNVRRVVRERSRPATDAELHRIRIAAKRLRYAADAFVPVYGARAARFAQRVAVLQAVLGEHRDASNACRLLRRNLGGGDGAFVAGELAGLERDAACAARRRWRAAWREVKRKDGHFWR